MQAIECHYGIPCVFICIFARSVWLYLTGDYGHGCDVVIYESIFFPLECAPRREPRLIDFVRTECAVGGE